MFKYTLVVILAASFANGIVLARRIRGTPEQRAAYAPDAFRLCASYIPNATSVEACLKQRQLELNDACTSYLRARCGPCSGQDHGIAPASGPKDEE